MFRISATLVHATPGILCAQSRVNFLHPHTSRCLYTFQCLHKWVLTSPMLGRCLHNGGGDWMETKYLVVINVIIVKVIEGFHSLEVYLVSQDAWSQQKNHRWTVRSEHQEGLQFPCIRFGSKFQNETVNASNLPPMPPKPLTNWAPSCDLSVIISSVAPDNKSNTVIGL